MKDEGREQPHQSFEPHSGREHPGRGKAQRAQANETRSEAVSGRDQAAFSEKARQLAKARAELSETSDVRTDLVADLRQRIETDNYQVPIEALTRRIVGLVRPE